MALRDLRGPQPCALFVSQVAPLSSNGRNWASEGGWKRPTWALGESTRMRGGACPGWHPGLWSSLHPGRSPGEQEEARDAECGGCSRCPSGRGSGRWDHLPAQHRSSRAPQRTARRPGRCWAVAAKLRRLQSEGTTHSQLPGTPQPEQQRRLRGAGHHAPPPCRVAGQRAHSTLARWPRGSSPDGSFAPPLPCSVRTRPTTEPGGSLS